MTSLISIKTDTHPLTGHPMYRPGNELARAYAAMYGVISFSQSQIDGLKRVGRVVVSPAVIHIPSEGKETFNRYPRQA